MERFAQRVMFVTECVSILGASCSVAFMLWHHPSITRPSRWVAGTMMRVTPLIESESLAHKTV